MSLTSEGSIQRIKVDEKINELSQYVAVVNQYIDGELFEYEIKTWDDNRKSAEITLNKMLKTVSKQMINRKKMNHNYIQKIFEDHGISLEEDDNMAELCDSIVNRINNKLVTQESFFDGVKFTNVKSRLDDLVERILKEDL